MRLPTVFATFESPPMIARVTSLLAFAALLGLALTGCGGSERPAATGSAGPAATQATQGTTAPTETTGGDTASVSTPTETQPETSAGVPTTTGSGGGTASGGGGSDPALAAAVADYQKYLEAQTASLVVRTTEFSKALNQGNPQRAV